MNDWSWPEGISTHLLNTVGLLVNCMGPSKDLQWIEISEEFKENWDHGMNWDLSLERKWFLWKSFIWNFGMKTVEWQRLKKIWRGFWVRMIWFIKNFNWAVWMLNTRMRLRPSLEYRWFFSTYVVRGPVLRLELGNGSYEKVLGKKKVEWQPLKKIWWGFWVRMIGLLRILTIELNECAMTQGVSTPLLDTAGLWVNRYGTFQFWVMPGGSASSAWLDGRLSERPPTVAQSS